MPEDGPPADAVAGAVGATATGAMRTSRIRDGHLARVAALDETAGLVPPASGRANDDSLAVAPRPWRLSLASFADRLAALAEEGFGPAGLVVTYPDREALTEVLAARPGSLTGSVHATAGDAAAAGRVAAVLRHRVGRLVHNGRPPPAGPCTTAARGRRRRPRCTPRLGATAIDRRPVPVAYQDWPDELLPPQLQDGNPLGIPRQVGWTDCRSAGVSPC
ncbi:hypothetical protein FRZ03_06715 [Streptomyces misionensis]|uniref:Uncharacterized protein n=1 Tax=Streptomyces misionensis TaxID=67331 RepID=A0A5C6JY39_9ACTN|nr:hypothetical protein [Streptomyces misionensis]TWV55652.1 hypothetical protein FRZ03_06715 [Streptomyces misionensis]